MKAKNLLVVLSVIFLGVNNLFATDRVVQHNGPVGTYSSISAAITAAVDGDNIVINNRQDALPWSENLTINKTLTLVSAVDNVQWWMNGNITIATAEGRNVTIVGGTGIGTVTKTGAIPVNRTLVNITFSNLGDLNLVSGVDLYLGSSRAGNITFSYGKIIGNELTSLTCSTDASATEDSNLIIGNKIGYSTQANYGFTNNSTAQYLYFSNNMVRGTFGGVEISTLKAGTGMNHITNCVMVVSATGAGTNSNAGLSINHTSGQLSVDNSMMGGNYVNLGSAYCSNGVRAGTTAATLSTFTYNFFYNPGGSTPYTPNSAQGNIPNSIAEYDNINPTTALPISGSGWVNAGSPMNQFLDLDLTRNDIGVYGGSYSWNNFLPFYTNTESSRVNFMNTPRVVNQGGTVNVQVIGYDK